VLNDAGEPVGIVTDRDLVVRVMAEGLGPIDTTVGEVMTRRPVAVREDESIESALAIMRRGPFRRLAVVDGAGKLVGLLSLDDILELLSEEFREIGQLIEKETPASLAEAL
jgi:CBS domain-containing protein